MRRRARWPEPWSGTRRSADRRCRSRRCSCRAVPGSTVILTDATPKIPRELLGRHELADARRRPASAACRRRGGLGGNRRFGAGLLPAPAPPLLGRSVRRPMPRQPGRPRAGCPTATACGDEEQRSERAIPTNPLRILVTSSRCGEPTRSAFGAQPAIGDERLVIVQLRHRPLDFVLRRGIVAATILQPWRGSIWPLRLRKPTPASPRARVTRGRSI